MAAKAELQARKSAFVSYLAVRREEENAEFAGEEPFLDLPQGMHHSFPVVQILAKRQRHEQFVRENHSIVLALSPLLPFPPPQILHADRSAMAAGLRVHQVW